MVISEMWLGRHLLWVVSWKVKLELIPSHGPGEVGWEAGAAPSGNGSASLGLLSGTYREVKAAEGHCGKQILAQQTLVQLPGMNCHFLMSLERRVSRADGLTVHTDMRHGQRCPKRAAPQGVCSTPVELLALGRLSQSSQSSEGG